jgi:sugar lactone lactonase YvrE
MMDTKVILEGLIFPECPRWHEGRLWFSDMLDERVIAVDPQGKAETITGVPGQPGGLGWLPDGRLLAVSKEERKLFRLDPKGLVEVADLGPLAKGHLNDMVVDRRGRAYIGDYGFDEFPGRGVPIHADLILVEPDGAARRVAEDVKFPNGAVITQGGRTLIVAESFALRIAVFDIKEDGSLANYRVWAELGEGFIPDGLCLDAEGAVWVANSMGNDVARVREGGEVTDRITVAKRAYACMLGGKDRRTLYLTTADAGFLADLAGKRSGRIEAVRVAVPGTGLP